MDFKKVGLTLCAVSVLIVMLSDNTMRSLLYSSIRGSGFFLVDRLSFFLASIVDCTINPGEITKGFYSSYNGISEPGFSSVCEVGTCCSFGEVLFLGAIVLSVAFLFQVICERLFSSKSK